MTLDPKAASLAFTAGNDNELSAADLLSQPGVIKADGVETHTRELLPGSDWATVDADPEAFFGGQAPAGVVRIAGEELLEAIESEEDIVRSNQELLEGTPQTDLQLEQWRRLYGEIMNEANKRLRGLGVMLMVVIPNPNGLGAVFTGVDLPRFEAAKNGGLMVPGGEDYEVVLTLPARERVDLRRAGREEFVRKFIGVICDAVLEQKAAYQARVVH